MDAKKLLKNYLTPKPWFLIVTVAVFVVGFAFIFIDQAVAFTLMMLDLLPLIVALAGHLPGILRGNKSIKQLEQSNMLDQVAGELFGQGATPLCDNRAVITPNYLFIKKRGVVCPVKDILWVYKHRQTTRCFFIPIVVVDSLYVRTARKIHDISLGKKDKKGLLTPAIMEIYKRNPRVLVGYSAENKKACDQLIKQAKQAAKN